MLVAVFDEGLMKTIFDVVATDYEIGRAHV